MLRCGGALSESAKFPRASTGNEKPAWLRGLLGVTAMFENVLNRSKSNGTAQRPPMAVNVRSNPIPSKLDAATKDAMDFASNPAFNLPLRATYGVERVHVTPEIAQHWLSFNTTNRIITQAKIEQFRYDMESGYWNEDGQAIRFAIGKLLDGQHRLMAIVLSGVKLPMLIVHGIKSEAQVTMDTGRSRTPKDVLTIEGLAAWDAGVAGNGIHALIAYEGGALPSTTQKATNREVRNFFLEHRSAVEATLQLVHDFPRRPPLMQSAIAFTLHYLFARKDHDRADAFFCGVFYGDNLSKTSPVFHLRQRLLNDLASDKKRSRFEVFLFAINAWNAFRRGATWKNSTSIFTAYKGEFPEIK